MEYKLALALKDAGFPLNRRWDMVKPRPESATEGISLNNPTLSELIEACDGNHKAFDLDHRMGKAHGWYASGGGFTEKGKTPEEAVAKLWLALNKND